MTGAPRGAATSPDPAARHEREAIRDAVTARCLAVLEAARVIHPELRRPLTWNGARAVCRRLEIPLVFHRMPRAGRVVALLGTPVIVLNPDVPPRRHTMVLAHEIAHVLLHVERDGEAVYHMDACWPDDPREDEAEVLATLLLGGPRFARHF